MYHRTEVRASGLPEMTSQKRVTFFLASSLMGEEGLMRNDTVGLSAKKVGHYYKCNGLNVLTQIGPLACPSLFSVMSLIRQYFELETSFNQFCSPNKDTDS